MGIGRVGVSTAGGRAGFTVIDELKPEDARQLADAVMLQARRLMADDTRR